MKKVILLAAIVLALPIFWMPACQSGSDAYKTKAENPELVHRGVRRITDIMRHDIFPPPVAARIYAYSTVAAYEALIPGYPEYRSLAGQLNGLTECPKPEAGKEYCFQLASVDALMKVGKNLIFSESSMTELEETVFNEFQVMDMPPGVYERSIKFGDAIADHIIKWSKGDHYAQTRSAPKFTINTKDPSRWVPTPPQYADAVEPHWGEIRPWVMDSSNQFRPKPHVPFSQEKGSEFMAAVMDVYNTSKTITEEQKLVARYWDCNPFEVAVSGHLMVATKKISPGGHWMNITAESCRIAKVPIMKSTEMYTMVALSLADAFLSAWTEKYTTNLIRPETMINRLVDPEWHPYIETPPFPEHTSAHSTISAAASTVLTHYLGEPFKFTDSTEMEFGLPARSFNSFFEAADEVAMSRLWGGIHYRVGNENGRLNGKEIGAYILDQVKMK